MKTYELLTIGYEGRDIDEFVNSLKRNNVTRLIDVREIPISRKKGFSKSILQNRLEYENIKYVHFRSLGSPSSIRKKLKRDWNYNYFFKEYSKYLIKNMEVIEKVHNYISDGKNCLMCFENSHEKCHRSIIASKLVEFNGLGIKLLHI